MICVDNVLPRRLHLQLYYCCRRRRHRMSLNVTPHLIFTFNLVCIYLETRLG